MLSIKLNKYLFICFFCIIIYFIFFSLILVPPKVFSYTENRNLSDKPILTKLSVLDGSYMDASELFINDHIIGRDIFVKLSTYSKIFLGFKDINNVYILKDSFIEKVDDLNSVQLFKNIGYLHSFTQKYNNSTIMLIPTSCEILGETLPKYVSLPSQSDLISEIYSNFSNTVNVIDLLNKHRTEYIYYKTDHHWTSLGAYYGYLSLCDTLNLTPIDLTNYKADIVTDSFNGTVQSKVNIQKSSDTLTRYLPLFDVTYSRVVNEEFVSDSLYDPSKLETKEKYAYFLGGNNAFVRVKSNIISNKKLLLIKDSFSHSLVPFLINHYSEIVLVDLRHYMGSLSDLIAKEVFDDIVVSYNIKNFSEEKRLILLNK